jgi:diaminopimelate epimerase
MNIPFYKCNSRGNDFFIISHPNNLEYKSFTKEKIRSICNYGKKTSVDGFILLENLINLKSMDYYNNDGSWETFCLNGIVCSALILKQECSKNNFEIVSNDIKYKIEISNDDNVKVQMSKPIYKNKNIKIDNYHADYLNSGAKHLVVKYDDDWTDNQKILQIMQKMIYNKIFDPEGVNVNFYKIINSGTIEVKTYEKGIESIMDSCASGSYACAYDYSRKNNHNKKINVINDGGESQIIFGRDYNTNFFISKGIIEYKVELEI